MVKNVSGSVDIMRQTNLVKAKTGLLLVKGDVLTTGNNSYAGIIFTDGTVITVGPKTEFRIDAYVFAPQTKEYDFSFYLEKGSAVYHSGKISKLSPESVKFSTPKATVGIRGTRFIIKVD
ncbi:MAG: FecR family protein [Proteobacteria bacterium]|nr:FecR domain-containing protein [Desulfobacula sp.]MBU3953612.1 FecR family protein [Pseudomonadota bacterium]MBU4133245.1 FecR family protein [Pseudomonadota bacterium]